MLLPLPNPPRSKVHPLGQRPAQRPQTEQPASQHDLRLKGEHFQNSPELPFSCKTEKNDSQS